MNKSYIYYIFKIKLIFKMDRFISMQRIEYPQAFNEIKRGRKISHWIWYIFPQIKGLGHSYMCHKYDIQSLEEAKNYLENEYLRNNLIKISKELLKHNNKDIKEIMNIDDIKLLSCMTLFKEADKEVNKCGTIFQDIINTFYEGKEDEQTLSILEKQKFEKKQLIEEKKIKVNEEKKNEKKDLVKEISNNQDSGEEMEIESENINEIITYYERKNTNDLNNLSQKSIIANKETKEMEYDKNKQSNYNVIENNNNFERFSMRNYYKKKNNEKNEHQTKITEFFKKMD